MRRWSMPGEMIGDELRRAPAIAEGEANAAAGEGRHVTRGIAYEENIRPAYRRDRSSNRYEPTSPLDHRCAGKTEDRLRVSEEPGEVRLGGGIGRKADLEEAGCGGDPGE